MFDACVSRLFWFWFLLLSLVGIGVDEVRLFHAI